MHRIHRSYVMQAGGFSKFPPGKSLISASATNLNDLIYFSGPFLSTGRICSMDNPPPADQRLFQLVRSALGWQRQELVILVSALAQSLLNFASVAPTSDKFFFCARKLLANP